MPSKKKLELCYTILYHTILYHTIPYHTILYHTIIISDAIAEIAQSSENSRPKKVRTRPPCLCQEPSTPKFRNTP